MRIPPQLFQQQKHNQTVNYGQEQPQILNSKRGKTSSRDTSPENRRNDQYTIQGRGITPNSNEYTMSGGNGGTSVQLNNKIFNRTGYKGSTAPSNPYTMNQPFTPVGMVTPLPEAVNRTNTALGYKQTNPNVGIMNNSLIVSNNIADIQAAQIIGRSRHSDRRDSNQIIPLYFALNQGMNSQYKRPQLSIDYQSIFTGGMIPTHHRGGSTVVNQNNNLNISELYGHYQNTAKAQNSTNNALKNTNLISSNNAQLFIPQSMKLDGKKQQQQQMRGSGASSQQDSIPHGNLQLYFQIQYETILTTSNSKLDLNQQTLNEISGFLNYHTKSIRAIFSIHLNYFIASINKIHILKSFNYLKLGQQFLENFYFNFSKVIKTSIKFIYQFNRTKLELILRAHQNIKFIILNG